MDIDTRAALIFLAIVFFAAGFASLFFHFLGEPFLNLGAWIIANTVEAAVISILISSVIFLIAMKK